MASMSFTQFSLVPRICKWHLNGDTFPCMNIVKIQDYRVNKKVVIAVSRNKIPDSLAEEVSDGEAGIVEEKPLKTRKRASARTRKKVTETPDENSSANANVKDEEVVTTSVETENSRKTQTRTRKKLHQHPRLWKKRQLKLKRVTRQRRPKKKKADDIDSQNSETEFSDLEEDLFAPTLDEDSEQELEFDIDDGEDISFTYGWPPLEALWEPEKFIRASGGCSSNVAVALASLGGKVAFMGKLGDDAYGQSLLYYLNINNVQTRSVRIDENRATAVSQMRIGKRGGLRMASVKSCAEDCLSRSEINIDVLKEAKMFYFNTFSLLDRNMRSTTLQAIKIAKKLGNVVFYDLNLPLPLWQSSEETKTFIQKAWNLSEIIEVTKQELEFLCGITPSEKFDTKDNDRSKFTHYTPDVVSRLWHDDLKVLFVTNGTSKIHYYTKEHNGFVHGMEDAPITPYTSDMSASGDGIVAGIMRMLTVQPHLISDRGYLERTIKYAISCGVIDQWLQARKLGYPAKEGMEDVVSDPHGIKSITEKEYRTLVPSS
ncbi:hypothetical protein DH2020_012070 [Rehmannia glutinosa]|uniref:Carbohydrate kinase PfkB domain-containing protein n=1 Tax=Rehmannia glutinosa TaxID=99300 RepID=A0ABR0XF90_REHGL